MFVLKPNSKVNSETHIESDTYLTLPTPYFITARIFVRDYINSSWELRFGNIYANKTSDSPL